MLKTKFQDFGINKPKIAVLALNPHAGDNGVIGKEDDEILKPSLKKLKNWKKNLKQKNFLLMAFMITVINSCLFI